MSFLIYLVCELYWLNTRCSAAKITHKTQSKNNQTYEITKNNKNLRKEI